MRNYNVHEIKLLEDYCDAVLSGEKTFEVRKNDRGYQKGDHISFIPVDRLYLRFYHPVSEKEYEITYVHSGLGLENGYVALAIKDISQINEEAVMSFVRRIGGQGMKYRKRPIEVEALQIHGNVSEIKEFIGENGDACIWEDPRKAGADPDTIVTIHTLEGDMRATDGDYIIKGVKGEFYPCRKDIFEETYELVESEERDENG